MAAKRREQAAGAIRERIASGSLAPGERIGASLLAIAEEYGVGKSTMREALADLAAEGLVDTVHGVGSFVTAAPPPSSEPERDEVADLRDDLGRVEAALIELYGKTGFDYPGRLRPARRSKEERREHAG